MQIFAVEMPIRRAPLRTVDPPKCRCERGAYGVAGLSTLHILARTEAALQVEAELTRLR